MFTLIVDQKEGMKNGDRRVGVHRRDNVGEAAEVAVDELTETAGVVDRAGAAAAGHIELEPW